MKYRVPMLLAAAGMLLLSGCGKSPETPQQEFSLVIEDATLSAAQQSAAETTAAAPETTAAEETTAGYLTETTALTEGEPVITEAVLEKDGSYTTKEDVSLYLYTYGELPQNFITKKEAQALGWSGGSLEPYAPGKCIGGSYFGNYEGNLPSKNGREYHECDIDTLGKSSRGAKRIVYSNDGLIFYTGDHYKTFELLYGEESSWK